MIAKISRGSSTPGLIRYLLGPTKDPSNVHHDQRAIASSASVVTDPEAAEHAGMSLERFIALQMDAARLIHDQVVTGGHVWHLSLSNRADDRPLEDDQWATIARHAMEALGFDDGTGTSAPCPWVAIRHGESEAGNDHVHVAVSLVREDGTVASNWRDQVKISAVCKEMEKLYGLHVVDGRTAGATPVPTRAEVEKTSRDQLPEPPRTRLARVVRAAAEASNDEAEFVRRLRSQRVAVRPRYADGDTSKVTGYSVADLSHGGPPTVWFGGGKLAKDLRLPALRAGWTDLEDQAAAWSTGTPSDGSLDAAGDGSAPVPADGSTVRREAMKFDGRGAQAGIDRVRQAAAQLVRADPANTTEWALAARRTAGALSALAARLEPDQPGPLSDLADLLAQSAQPAPRLPAGGGALAGVATLAAVANLATDGVGSDAALWWLLAAELVKLAAEIQRGHVARGELQRASAIRGSVDAAVATLNARRPATTTSALAPTRQPTQSTPPTPTRDFER